MGPETEEVFPLRQAAGALRADEVCALCAGAQDHRFAWSASAEIRRQPGGCRDLDRVAERSVSDLWQARGPHRRLGPRTRRARRRRAPRRPLQEGQQRHRWQRRGAVRVRAERVRVRNEAAWRLDVAPMRGVAEGSMKTRYERCFIWYVTGARASGGTTPRRPYVQESWSALRTGRSTAAARNAARTANRSVEVRPSIGDANMFNNGNLMTRTSPPEACRPDGRGARVGLWT